MVKIFLGLGSNLGNRDENIRSALRLLNQHVENICISSFYETAPVGVTDQPVFLNIACSGHTELSPYELLDFILGIEKELGRIRTLRWGPRTLDIDILFYGDKIISSPNLEVPHPHIAERLFVLVPLAEIASDFVHPVSKVSVKTLVDAFPQNVLESMIRKLE
ncbi:MAG: 2-amino-4-hydroxy-6-hydroxymethyldihydropteridine diphosphokinase [Candidatus Riflebacteria bacterium]|nr:2-amino-4-hydroxy-6-hydroxymethyldihydropteridine diphosphokinase [Candidatus Riflebacteria bacterium]